MTYSEARIPGQADADREESWDRRRCGLPSVSWLYWHRELKWLERPLLADGLRVWVGWSRGMKEPDAIVRRPRRTKEEVAAQRAVAADLARERREEARARARRKYEVGGWFLRGDPFAAMEAVPEVNWAAMAAAPSLGERPIREDLLVNRGEYLSHVNKLMEEWGIVTSAQFDQFKGMLIRHALHRMGKL